MDIWMLIISSLYFFLPAYVANMAPVFAKKLKVLDRPISTRKLGKNKTWRGFVVGTLAGGVVFWLQKVAYVAGYRGWAIIDYSDFSLWLGFLLGFGALLGDAVKSYYKRKAEIKPGEPWIGFDQLDFVIGGLTIGFLAYVPPAEVMLTLMIASPVLHILTNRIGYWLKIRDVKC